MDRALARRLVLPPEPTSPGIARRLLRDLLAEADREEWLDAAVLAVSEIVTNVVLHAHTPLELRVTVDATSLLVEVSDDNPALPLQRSYGAEATTGRGMDLVASVTSSHGLQSTTEGKVVWFRIVQSRGEPGADLDQLLERWDLAAEAGSDRVAEVAPSREVVLHGLPPTLWLAAEQHHDAMLRELSLHRAEHPSRADLVAADAARALLSEGVSAAIEAARAQGLTEVPLPHGHPSSLPDVPRSLDLVLPVRPEQAEEFAQLQDALDEAERLAGDGLLLVQAGLPEVIAVRDWACEQVIAQLGGAPSSTWEGADSEVFAASGPREDAWRYLGDWEDTVSPAAEMAVAADQSNRIIAVSTSLASRLGWQPEELVGRRVVAIVPHRYREAHVAGFSRHLNTGKARVLGVPLTLPVMHRDGREHLAGFVITAHRTPSGRVVYVTILTPLPGAAD